MSSGVEVENICKLEVMEMGNQVDEIKPWDDGLVKCDFRVGISPL
jgi:hypothetical protein